MYAILTTTHIGQASNRCHIMNSCAITLPTKPNDSITVDEAPIFTKIGQSAKEARVKTIIKVTLSFDEDFRGLAPLGPHPNQPQIPPAINTNWSAALA